MADLKSGTTIGGNTVFTQGNLPIVPAGNLITYRGWRIYTEQDKPNNVDVGLGNVTNDAQVKKSGDTMTGNLIIDGKDLTVGNKVYLLQKTTGTNTTMIVARADTALRANSTPPTSDTEQFTLQTRHQSTDSNPLNGPLLSQYYTGRKANNGAGVTKLTSYSNSTVSSSGVINPGVVSAELTIDGATALVSVSAGEFYANLAQMGTLTTSNLNVYSSANFGGTFKINARNAGIELGSISQSGTSFIDFHTSGTDIDYDFRLQANETGLSLDNAGTANYDFFMQKTKFLRLSTTGPSGITGKASSIILNDLGNGGVSLSASRNASSDTTGGSLYLGYNLPDSGIYTSAVRLESPMTWKGTKQLVDSNGSLVSTSMNGGDLTTANLQANGTISGSSFLNTKADINVYNPDPVNPANGSWQSTAGIYTGFTTRGAWNGGAGRGRVGFYLQENVGVTHRGVFELNAFGTVHYAFLNADGSFQPEELRVDGTGSKEAAIRLTKDSKTMLFRNDGSNMYFLIADSPSGSWNTLRPLTINMGTGISSMNNGAVINGGLGVNTGNSWAGASIALGDSDSGFRQGGDGIIQVWCNNQRTAHFDTGQAYFDKRIQGPAGASITDVNVYSGDLNQSNDNYSTYCRDLYVRSDIRVKKDLKIFVDAAQTLLKVGGYTYLQKKGQNEDGSDKYIQSAGLIAQEVQAIMPELVSKDKETGLLRLNYNGVIGLNTAAINEHTQTIEKHEKTISELTDLVESLAKRLKALENK